MRSYKYSSNILNFEKDLSAEVAITGPVKNISQPMTTLGCISEKLFQRIHFSSARVHDSPRTIF